MIKNKFFTKLFIIYFITSFSYNAFGQENNPSSNLKNTAQIQVLNKITAKSSDFTVRIGNKIEFGQITITAQKCWQAPLDQKPESKILLKVTEKKLKEVNQIFHGWMFASSPSVSGLEHPIYDIIAINCKDKNYD